MKTGFIETQLGLAAHIKPKGAIKAAWRAFIAEQVERDERRLYASQEPDLRLVGPLEDEPLKPFPVRFIEGLKAVIP